MTAEERKLLTEAAHEDQNATLTQIAVDSGWSVTTIQTLLDRNQVKVRPDRQRKGDRQNLAVASKPLTPPEIRTSVGAE
ncbi:hypothetical protein [Streptomyces sp. NPDC056672]|uniref:hypothetical protein n=1 Tax=Streptomyces sp. NPDC056672 TaxID=3345906 RepID=UPI00368BA51B